MITPRRSAERGTTHLEWLDSWHTFSFGDYHDPRHMGFRDLRVINEDVVAPGRGFGTHPHRDMEIVTYLLSGTLQHRDSMGNGSLIRPGEVQRMTAGRGVTHSEFNPSPSEAVHLLQIWILPEAPGLEPGYEQRRIAIDDARGRLRLVASHDGRDGAVAIHQDASLHVARLAPGEGVTHELAPGRHAWIQIAEGGVTVDGVTLGPGDGAAVDDERRLALTATSDGAHVLVFDLA